MYTATKDSDYIIYKKKIKL